MLDVAAVEPVDDRAASGGRAREWSVPPTLLAGVAVVVALGRWGFSHDRRVVHLAPDEPAQLAMARWLAGGTRWNMFDHSTWRPGLATLLTPFALISDDGPTLVRVALTLNAVLAGVAAVFLVLLVRRLTALSTWASAAIATVVALAPSSLSASGFVWAESLVSLTFLATCWYLVRFGDDRRVGTALVAVAWAIAGFTSHSRLVPLVAIAIAITAALLLVQRRWWAAVGTAAFGVAGWVLSNAYATFIYDAVWDDPGDNNTSDTVVGRLDAPQAVLEALAGQVWYQLAATVGLAGIGAVAIGRAARGRDGARVARDARIVLAVTVPLVAVSAVFMSGRSRPDQLVYGRYNDAVLWPVVALGLATLVGWARDGLGRRDAAMVAAVGGTLIATGAWVEAVHGDVFHDDIGVRAMVSGVLAMNGAQDALGVVRVTAIALVLLAAAVTASWLAARSPTAAAAAVVAGVAVLAAGGIATYRVQAVLLNTWESAEAVREIDTVLPERAEIGVMMVPNDQRPSVSWNRQRRRYQMYQLYLSDHRVEREPAERPAGPYVFAPNGDPTLRGLGAEVLWTDPDESITLWHLGA